MELVVEEKPLDASVAFRCDLCNYNPYQAWCKGNVARFHAALMKHKQTIRHKEAEAFAKGEQPISISKEGVVSANPPNPDRPSHFYITKLEKMIDVLEQRIDALNGACGASETSDEYNQKKFGSLVGDFDFGEQTQKSQKSGELVNSTSHKPLNAASVPFQFKEVELRAMRKFGDGSCITNANTLNAIQRCLNWCEVCIKDEVRRERNVAYLTKTREMIKSVCAMIEDGWRADDDDYDEIGNRLDGIMEHPFYAD
jgi:hypothetical protein